MVRLEPRNLLDHIILNNNNDKVDIKIVYNHGNKKYPEIFEKYFSSLMTQETEKHSSDKQFVFINAWNEWAEGTYLEPDMRNGYAYLEAVQRSVHSINNQ